MLRNNTFRSRVELWRPTVTPKIFLPSKNQFSPYWEQYYPCWKWAISLNLKALPTTTESKGWLAIWLVLGYFCHYHGEEPQPATESLNTKQGSEKWCVAGNHKNAGQTGRCWQMGERQRNEQKKIVRKVSGKLIFQKQ